MTKTIKFTRTRPKRFWIVGRVSVDRKPIRLKVGVLSLTAVFGWGVLKGRPVR